MIDLSGYKLPLKTKYLEKPSLIFEKNGEIKEIIPATQIEKPT
jgi:hypothetical protein